MRKRIDEAYFGWLVEKTGQPGYGREKQIEVLWNVDFKAKLKDDENRAWYGKHLRELWFEDFGQYSYTSEEWLYLNGLEVSLLEVMLALSESMWENSDDTSPYSPIGWFWVLMENLGIGKRTSLKTVRDTAEKCVERHYFYSGEGGLFPLKNPEEDQRKVTIWYQMMAFLRENRY